MGSSERERAPLCGIATIEEAELGGMSDADAAGESPASDLTSNEDEIGKRREASRARPALLIYWIWDYFLWAESRPAAGAGL